MSSSTVHIPVVAGTAALPSRMRSGDAAFDLRAAESCVIGPGTRALVKTGLHLAIPEGFAGLVLPRSGLALNHGITVLNAPGLIDSNYRGDIGVILLNTDPHESFTVSSGDRIAQLLIVPAADVAFTLTDELSETERGESGFGSSGRA